MKKIVLLLAAVCLLFSCERNNSKLDEFSVNTLSVNDSLQYPEEYLNEWDFSDVSYFQCEVDAPVTKNQALHDSIVEWMACQLVDVNEVTTRDLEELIKKSKDVFFDLESSEAGSESSISLKLQEVNDRYVTFCENSYYYMGGAHGMWFGYGATFDRISGKRFSYEMFKSLDGLNEVVMEGLANQYFTEDYLDESEDLLEFLMIDADEPFPLPYTQPWISHDSIHFCYSLYEIAPYFCGEPECAFPYSEMEPFLTEEGKSYFADKTR